MKSGICWFLFGVYPRETEYTLNIQSYLLRFGILGIYLRVQIPSQQLLGWLGKGGGVKSLVFCKGFCIDTLRIGGTPIFCQPATLTNLGSNRPRWLLAHEVQANADHVIG